MGILVKILGILAIVVVVLVLLATGYLFYQGAVSRSGEAPGLVDGRLAPCPNTPNCISSEDPDDRGHFLPPLTFTPVDDLDVRAFIASAVEETGGVITSQSENYISAEYRSGLIGFVDDVEFRIDDFNGVVHIRSASRVGRSDLGANPARYEAIREMFEGAFSTGAVPDQVDDQVAG